jgi:hypothetical protein
VYNEGGVTNLNVRNNTLTGTPASYGQQVLSGSGLPCGNEVANQTVDPSCSGIAPRRPGSPATRPDLFAGVGIGQWWHPFGQQGWKMQKMTA